MKKKKKKKKLKAIQGLEKVSLQAMILSLIQQCNDVHAKNEVYILMVVA